MIEDFKKDINNSLNETQVEALKEGTKTHLNDKDRHYLRVKGWKSIFQANGLKKHTGVPSVHLQPQ